MTGYAHSFVENTQTEQLNTTPTWEQDQCFLNVQWYSDNEDSCCILFVNFVMIL